MAISRVTSQDASGSGTSGSATATYAATPTQNDLLVVAVQSVTTTISLSGSGWQTAKSQPFNSNNAAIVVFYKIAGASEPTSVTATGASTTNIVIYEYTGNNTDVAAVLDVTQGANSGVTNVSSQSTGTTATTALADELLFTAVGSSGAVASLAWTNSVTALTTNGRLGSGQRIVAATGTYESTASWTTAGKAGAAIATFKAAVAVTGLPERTVPRGVHRGVERGVS